MISDEITNEVMHEPSPWAGDTEAFPKGTTHKVLGHRIPASISMQALTELGSCLVLDGYGEDPLEGEGLPPLPEDEVAELLEYVTKHNNRHGNQVSRAAVANALAMARVYRYDHKSVAEMLLRKVLDGKLPPDMGRDADAARERLERRLADPSSWSLWEVCSGEWLTLETVEGDDGDETIVDGGPYVLTKKGEAMVGAPEGVIPMWSLMADCADEDPYDCEGMFRRLTFESLVDNGLVRDGEQGGIA